MKKLIFILMVSSLFGEVGIGLHLQSVPKISIPIKFNKMIIEPSIQYSLIKVEDPTLNFTDGQPQVYGQQSVSSSILLLGIYRSHQIFEKLHLLGGFNIGGRENKIVNSLYTDTDLITVLTFNLGFQYKLNSYCDLGYELVDEHYFSGTLKNGTSELTSNFIIRIYK